MNKLSKIMEIKCDHCNIFKTKEDFYKNNLSKCKEFRKVESRNGKFSILNEIFIKKMYSSLKKIEKQLKTNNNIDKINKKSNKNIETIINYKRNNIILDDKHKKIIKL